MGEPWLFWAGVWLAAVIAAIAVLLARRAPTMWRGRSLLSWTIGLALVAVAVTLAENEGGLGTLVVVMGGLVLISRGLRARALIAGRHVVGLEQTIEDSARRVNLSPQSVAGGYLLPLPGGGLEVTLRPIGKRLTLLTMRAIPPHRKAELFARLVAKQYRGVLPTLVIRDWRIVRRRPG